MPTTWAVVVPVKRLPAAKTRLRPLPGQVRTRLALAMAVDTVAAALAAEPVGLVVVVTDDPAAVASLTETGALVVPDQPRAGLDPALEHGAARARDRLPAASVAALAADLPALRPAELAAALAVAGGHRRAVVADARGRGTTLLTAAAGETLRPRFGAGSLRRHVADGAVRLPVRAPGLRRDVDTVADLAAARRLGVGARTAAILAGLGDG